MGNHKENKWEKTPNKFITYLDTPDGGKKHK